MIVILRLFTISLILFFSINSSTYATQKKNDFRIVSTVNGDVITNFDINQRTLILKLLKVNISKKQIDVRNRLIDEALQKQFAESTQTNLTIEEINQILKEFLATQKVSNLALAKVLKENKIEWLSLKEFIETKALWKKSLLKSFGQKAIMTDHDLNLPSESRLSKFKTLLDLSEIVMPISERGESTTLLLAERLKIELNAGGNFSIAAKRFSRSQTSSNGGRIGVIEAGSLSKELEEVISQLSEKEISDPIIKNRTVILIKLNERKIKEIRSELDYDLNFVFTEGKMPNGVDVCKTMPSDSRTTKALSALETKYLNILQNAKLFKPYALRESHWVILCKRKVKGTTQQINKKKSKYFNDEMINYSEKTMLNLYREAIIQ